MSATVAQPARPKGPGLRLAAVVRPFRALGVAPSLAAVILTVAFVAAVFAPLIAPYDPAMPDLYVIFAGPSSSHLLGTDGLGRDLLSIMIWGARPSLLGGVLVIAVSSVVGTALGVVMGWRGGVVDAIGSRVLDVMFGVPSIIFALVAVAVMGAGWSAAVAGLMIAYTPYTARLVRAAVLRERSLPYVASCTVLGYSASRVCLWHLLPNLRTLIVSQGVAALGFAIVDLAGISFLGLGVQPPTTDWGLSVANGLQAALQGHAAEAIYAAVAIIAVVASANILADRLGRNDVSR